MQQGLSREHLTVPTRVGYGSDMAQTTTTKEINAMSNSNPQAMRLARKAARKAVADGLDSIKTAEAIANAYTEAGFRSSDINLTAIWRLVERLTDEAECREAGVDPRVVAIRADKVVGRYTCSFIDEAMSHNELVAALDAERIRSPRSAVAWARRQHRQHEAYAADIRATAGL